MPADASIYSMIRPPAAMPGPMDTYAQGLQLRHLLDSSELSQLQRKQLTKQIQEDEATSQAYSQSGGDPTRLKELLYGKGLYKPALAAEKNILETQKARGEIDKTKLETLGKSLTIHRDQLAGVDNPQAAAQWLMSGFNDPVLSPIMQRLGGPEELIRKIPQDPAAFQDWKMKNGLGIEKVMELTAPKMQVTNLGGKSAMVDTNPRSSTFDPNASLDHTQTPDSIATNATTRRGQNMTDERARITAERDKFGQPFEATGSDGKPRLVMQNKNSGEIVDATTKQPVAGVAPKIGEAAQKQVTGVQNTRAALGEYISALEGWKGYDALRPDERAKMGTVYNNALLQAKEAFNLGVLNGPDYKILQEVLTDPSSLKGGITSNEALKGQAEKLREIMGRVGTTVTQTQTGNPRDAKADTQRPTRAEIDAELRRRKVIK